MRSRSIVKRNGQEGSANLLELKGDRSAFPPFLSDAPIALYLPGPRRTPLPPSYSFNSKGGNGRNGRCNARLVNDFAFPLGGNDGGNAGGTARLVTQSPGPMITAPRASKKRPPARSNRHYSLGDGAGPAALLPGAIAYLMRLPRHCHSNMQSAWRAWRNRRLANEFQV